MLKLNTTAHIYKLRGAPAMWRAVICGSCGYRFETPIIQHARAKLTDHRDTTGH